MRHAALLWPGAIALLGIGVALVFASVLAPGLFLAGVVLIDIGLVLLGVAALLGVFRARAPA